MISPSVHLLASCDMLLKWDRMWCITRVHQYSRKISYDILKISLVYSQIGSGKLDFDAFCRVAGRFAEEDDEALQKELKEAFRLYDKEGMTMIHVF